MRSEFVIFCILLRRMVDSVCRFRLIGQSILLMRIALLFGTLVTLFDYRWDFLGLEDGNAGDFRKANSLDFNVSFKT